MHIVDNFITINFPLGVDLPDSFEIDVLSLASKILTPKFTTEDYSPIFISFFSSFTSSFALETCSSVP
ncbi:hypothetical protein CLK_3690 [Clostridium botulinum A3 str. Loch Maree]|nr:hypothetical protein CLK_3690 [Clostridium botulinum A3 str. Loch Maree]